ncbi:MAG: branched-chain amino acid aminotransferase [Pelagibacteraceae bacterium TMED65]|nr:MAG: branched-chain amino acid aminotransferase [Pelagibacteraceae bacterium TMED65]
MKRVVYMNGQYVSEKDAKISIFDSALMFGDMVFEMTRSFNKKQFKLREHLERLYMGIKILRIPISVEISELEQICYDVVEQNEPAFEAHDEHRLMINVSRGPLGIYSSVFDGKIEPTLVVADFPLKWTVASLAPLFRSGINAVIPSQRAIPGNLLDPKIKNRSRIFYQMANIEASQVKGENNWALLLDPDGHVTEGTGDNFFIIKKGKILTPEGRNILRGISRDYIFELASQLDIPCTECNIEPYDVYEADEAFMTATPFCILPTVSLQGIKIGEGKMGPITKMLLDKWSSNVGVNIQGQIEDYAREVSTLKHKAPTPYQFSSS